MVRRGQGSVVPQPYARHSGRQLGPQQIVDLLRVRLALAGLHDLAPS